MFDAVACQFGVMFVPERSRAYAEVRRVLGPGDAFIFNVRNRIGENEFADAIGGRFGRGAVDGRIQAHVVTVEK